MSPEAFADLPPRARRALESIARPRSVAPNEILFRVGDAATSVLAVTEGEIELLDAAGDLIGVATKGDFLGEVGFLLGQPRTATARAAGNGAMVAEVAAQDVEALLATSPELVLELSRQLSRKLATRASSSTTATRLAVVAGDPRPILRAVAAAHVGQIGVCDGPRTLPAGLRRVPPSKLLAHLRSGARSLDELNLIIVCAGEARSLVADVAAPTAEWALAAGAPPRWLAALSRRVLDTTDEPSLARALRWMTGRAVGLALSSGGSKTCAHIGVMRALADAGIAVDAISGCSGGAPFAVSEATGVPHDEMELRAAILGEVLSGGRFDVLPRLAQQKSRRVHDLLTSWSGDVRLESTPIPVALVATDLATGSAEIFERGDAVDGICASMAIPGLLPPWRIGDRWYTDGAVVDPLPVAALRSLGVGTVIASNVAGRGNRAGSRESSADRAPGLLAVISSVVTASEAARVSFAVAAADLVITPEVDAANSFDFGDIPGFVKAGRTAAEAALASAASLTVPTPQQASSH